MKKLKVKGFTLVELIVVMVIVAILMAAIMQLFGPIKETYVDSTLNETRRTAQNGISQYITESIRYATDLGVYSPGESSVIEGHTDSVSNVSSAITAFTRAYLFENGIYENNYTDPVTGYTLRKDDDYTAKFNNTKAEIIKKAEIIVIDNSAVTYNGKSCYGRVVRRKPNASAVAISEPSLSSLGSDWRLALGAAYYGENTYSIAVTIPSVLVDPADASPVFRPDGNFDVTVSSTNNGKRSVSKKAARDAEDTAVSSATDLSALGFVSTNGGANCRNIGPTVGGMFDISKFDCTTTNVNVAQPDGSTKKRKDYTGGATKNEKTYIIYINDEIKITA